MFFFAIFTDTYSKTRNIKKNVNMKDQSKVIKG